MSIFSAEYSRSKTPLQIEHHDLRLGLRDQRADLLRDALGIEEEQPALQPQQQQARERLVVRVLGRARPEHVRAALAAEHVDRRIRRLLSERDERDDDRHENALQACRAA